MMSGEDERLNLNPLYRHSHHVPTQRPSQGEKQSKCSRWCQSGMGCCALLSIGIIIGVVLFDDFAGSHDSYLDEFSIPLVLLIIASLTLLCTLLGFHDV